jgi:hypothetical protein
MNRTVAVAALAMLLSSLPLAAAQTAAPAAKSGVSGVIQPAPAASPPKVSSRPARAAVDPDADARMCLGFATNDQIIRCAEKYLPRRVAAK